MISTIINTHGNLDVTLDTVDSVAKYMTNQYFLLIEGSAWDKFQQVPILMLKGFDHNYFKAPYRNVALGLMTAYARWPESDWFCYLEYDALIGSFAFKKDLIQAEKDNIWCLGADYREKQEVSLSLVELMLKTKFSEIFYVLGAVVFLHRNFMQKAGDFFSKFLTYTNDFKNDFMPGYTGWDVTEHLLPTLVKHWGGGVRQLCQWSQKGAWGGNYKRYPIRWKPDLTEQDGYISASIMHPIKNIDNQIRIFHREKRNAKRI